ncbi:GAF domain-containing protein [Chryseolinea lacunae]|uniref:histidine kinase n=1 Tax=Chryseolinea lacunae TaxID=2801331 RepID=A0ABS1L0N1_9BACT|nr:GAF domain-containing protein [Chryseolinea lacunae]MBL0745261.1 PAS domain-containing protein [Chryseolinea lacunae]
MDEHSRLIDLLEYHILDTPPEKGLDDLVDIASAICGTPISLITFIDDKRQWFKAVKGLDDKETLRSDSFCQHALTKPKELLVVNDPLNDERFKNNRYVTGTPNIRFYAGAPLETPKGNVLGTLCVIDDKTREISEEQKRALQLLAKKVMDILNARKLLHDQEEQIESSAVLLKKLTDQAPGCIYQFEMNETGDFFFHFISNGITSLNPLLTPDAIKSKTVSIMDLMHADDKAKVRSAIDQSYKNLSDISVEFRMTEADPNKTSWYWAKAKPEKMQNGNVLWYGTFQDISNRKAYEEALEQITHDISHVLRRPVATMLGLTSVIEMEKPNHDQLLEYINYIKVVSQEMDNFTRRLNAVYSKKKEALH